MPDEIRIEPIRYRVEIPVASTEERDSFEMSPAMIKELRGCEEKKSWRSGAAIKALLDRRLVAPTPGSLSSTTRGDRRGMEGCEVPSESLPQDLRDEAFRRYVNEGVTEYFYSSHFRPTSLGRSVLAAIAAFEERAGV